MLALLKRLGCSGACAGKTRTRSGTRDSELTLPSDAPYFSLAGKSMWAKVVSIYDADTLTLIFLMNHEPVKFRCRLADIDAPEKRSADPIERACSDKAIQRLKELIGQSQMVYIKCGAFDKYGRLLVELYNATDSASINQILIDEKLAYRYDGGTKKQFSEWTQ
jgi:endonuclease YncB( thermonuclease family)